MEVRRYDENELCRKLGVTIKEFHEEVKPLIKKEFKNLLRANGITNPDILVGESNILVFGDPKDHSRTVVTDVDIYIYKKDIEED